MEFVVGAGLSVAVFIFALLTGFDRDRVFYPTLLIVTASYYSLFAVMGTSVHALSTETLVASLFVAMAVIGFKKNLWLVGAAFVGHAIFDFFHQRLIDNSGMPASWPGFCLTFDICLAACFALLLTRRSGFAKTA
jgi:hypothetical protein